MRTIRNLHGLELPLYCLDFETYYDDDYSLKKMSTIEYIRDPRFKAHGCAVVEPDGWSHWVTHKDLPDYFGSLDWDSIAVLGQHTNFDGAIISEIYGYVANYYLCTMFQSAGVWGPGVPHSLVAQAERLESSGKAEGGMALQDVKGVRELSCSQEGPLAFYGIQDAEVTVEHFEKMMDWHEFPEKELHVIDLTIKAFVRPLFRINAPICRAEIEEEEQRFARLMESDLVGDADLTDRCKEILEEKGVPGLIRSRDCFAELFYSRGVVPPMKHAQDKNKNPKYNEDGTPTMTFAFSKEDVEFQAMRDDDRVADLVYAKSGFSSNQRYTRAKTFLDVTHEGTRPLPIPLRAYGGRTHRWSANDKEHDNDKGNPYNPQNLQSGRDGGSTRMRDAIIAPEGWKILIADSGQIECRFGAWLAGEKQLLEDFKAYDEGDVSKDPYCLLASSVFHKEVQKGGPNGELRTIGKEGELSLSFGVGPPKFYHSITARYGFSHADFVKTDQDRAFVESIIPEFESSESWRKDTFDDYKGLEIQGEGDDRYVFDLDKGIRYELAPFLISWKTVHHYRSLRTKIVGAWNELDGYLAQMAARLCPDNGFTWRDVIGIYNQKILMPNDLFMYYRHLHWSTEHNGYVYKHKKEWNRIYKSKLYQHIVQSGSRTIVAEQAVEVGKELPIALLVHDEIVGLAPEKEAEDAAAFMSQEMRKAPSWCSDIPLNCEVQIKDHYAK